MDERYWKLLTSIFIIAASMATLYAVIVLTGGAYNGIAAVLVLACIAGILVGTVKGAWNIFCYHRENKE